MYIWHKTLLNSYTKTIDPVTGPLPLVTALGPFTCPLPFSLAGPVLRIRVREELNCSRSKGLNKKELLLLNEIGIRDSCRRGELAKRKQVEPGTSPEKSCTQRRV